MAKYIVITIAMSIKNNRIAEAGDMVDESQLNSSPYELIKGNFIRPATDEELKVAGEDFVEAEIVDDSGLSDEEKAAIAQKEKEEQDALALFASRKKVLTDLGFVEVDVEDFKGLSFPDTGVNFSYEDIQNATAEEFDLRVQDVKVAATAFNPKEEDGAKNAGAADAKSAKDSVKYQLTGKK